VDVLGHQQRDNRKSIQELGELLLETSVFGPAPRVEHWGRGPVGGYFIWNR
jgi:hypothetical protein